VEGPRTAIGFAMSHLDTNRVLGAGYSAPPASTPTNEGALLVTVGAQERTMIVGYLVWVVALAIQQLTTKVSRAMAPRDHGVCFMKVMSLARPHLWLFLPCSF